MLVGFCILTCFSDVDREKGIAPTIMAARVSLASSSRENSNHVVSRSRVQDVLSNLRFERNGSSTVGTNHNDAHVDLRGVSERDYATMDLVPVEKKDASIQG